MNTNINKTYYTINRIQYRSYDEWLKVGRHVIKGQKSPYKIDNIYLFSINQTEEHLDFDKDYDPNENEDYEYDEFYYWGGFMGNDQ